MKGQKAISAKPDKKAPTDGLLLISDGHRAWLDAQCRTARAALEGIARMNDY